MFTWPPAGSKPPEAVGAVCLPHPLGPEPLPHLPPKHTHSCVSITSGDFAIVYPTPLSWIATFLLQYFVFSIHFYLLLLVSASGPGRSAAIWSSHPLWLWLSSAQLWPAYTRRTESKQ